MPPVAEIYNKGLWEESVYESLTLVFDCLLPTGVIIQLEVGRHSTLQEIKEKLWREAQLYPLYTMLKDKHFYGFMCISEMGDRLKLEDETVRISYVRPFTAMLKIVEKTGNKAENILNAQISVLIGKGLHEFESLKEPEVHDFRIHMKKTCERVVKDRDDQSCLVLISRFHNCMKRLQQPPSQRLTTYLSKGDLVSRETYLFPWLQKVMCFYPPDIASDPDLPPHLMDKLTDYCRVVVKLKSTNVSYTFQVSCVSTPEQLCHMALEKSAKTSGQPVQRANKYALKVVGREEFLLGDYPLNQFMYIRQTVSKGLMPTLLLVYRDEIFAGEAPMIPARGTSRAPEKNTTPPSPHPQRKGKNLWEVEGTYSLTISGVTNVNLPTFNKVQLRCCIYHGSEPLCPVNNTREVPLVDGLASWKDEMSFDILVKDLPRMARLCFLLYTISDRRMKDKRPPTGGANKKHNKHTVPLAWVNITLFDYLDYLRTGAQTLYMWSITDDCILTEELLNPIGTVECNPHASEAVCLNFFFNKPLDVPIFYPPFEKVLDVAAQIMNVSKGDVVTDVEGMRKTFSGMAFDEKLVTRDKLELLRLMVDRDPLDPLHEHEKETIWNLRFECNFHFKDSLPKLLTCVNWGNHLAVAQMQALLQIWHELDPTKALELLDHQYADKAVRKFAVDCLKNLSDSEVYHYLLQLIQALKYESYLECDLVEFLLKKALHNQRIGHALFWLLRAEMHVPSVSVRFGLILEAYCRGNINHLKGLVKQVEALGKLKLLSEAVKKFSKDKEKSREEMRNMILQQPYYSALSDITSPLDPGQRFKSPNAPSCKFMDSKMKPLWLVMENADTNGDDIYIMYKRGDDLRQDMLTLQILRIMDAIWQSEGLDLRLNAYSCLSTGHHEGFIQVVTNSDTVANIQKQQGTLNVTAAFNKQSLYKYLEFYNKDPQSLQDAMQEFSRSCAGYSVATYVLGVADRHSDNIMLKQNGQFFHIDFGHILGHFKYKLGVKRERVPFVLTTDFVYVIRKGPEKNDAAFKEFQKICEDAYMALRRKSNLLITLFLMMMNTGIPEVSCTKDIEYLKETLKPHVSDQEALDHFRSKFKEALKNSWKASLNFAARNLKGDNT